MHTHSCGNDVSLFQLRTGFASVRRALLLGFALVGGIAWAHVEPKDRERLPDFDRREQRATTTAAGHGAVAKSAALDETRLRNRVRGVAVDRDPLTGAAAFVGSPDTFLTGENGQGGAVSAARLAALPAAEPQREVKAFLDEHRAVFGHGAETLAQTRVARDYVTGHNGLRTTVWQQQVDGIDVFGATLQAHVTKRGELVNVASRLLRDAPSAVPAAQRAAKGSAFAAGISAEAAVAAVARSLGEPLDAADVVALNDAVGAEERQCFEAEGVQDAYARRVWLPVGETQLVLCWEVVATIADRGEMFRVLVAADDGEILVRHGLTNYISNASYRVFTSDSPSPWSPGPATPVGTQPAQVPRSLVTIDALDTTASPNGWINDGGMETIGNNVDAHTDTNADDLADTPRPQATGAGRVFDPPLDLTLAPSSYKDAAVVDLFYWCNLIHDRFYQLGFTEAAGNFQTNNFGRGGLGNDAVQADAQDGSGTNNANFSTPPDGSPGRMQMYVFSAPAPDRDGDFDHEVVIHEYAHGLSNRLVGGGVGISALQSRGMGEGWGDFYGLALLSEAGDDLAGNYAAGGYATKDFNGQAENYYFGIRRYPYSTNLLKNPLTYRDIDPTQANAHAGIPRSVFAGSAADEVHNMGEVWCVTLWDVRANLITKHGDVIGNELTLKLVTDGMKLSPANPTFLQMRDAILQADLVLNAGANRIEIWAAFAKRGMGSGATSPSSSTTVGVTESYDLPDSLGVSPSGVTAWEGTIGGPFPPAPCSFTLLNSGTTSLNWTAGDDAAWLNLSAASGTLASGASTVVTASPNAAASALTVGTYTATITFTNSTSGVAQTRTISLTALPFTEPVFAEDFESLTLNPAMWTVTGTGTYRSQLTTLYSPHGGSRHLTMDSSDGTGSTYVRNEVTLTLDLTGGNSLQLSFWAKIFNDDPHAPAIPFTGGADFDGVAISANGTTWYEVQALRTPTAGGTWAKYTVDLDAKIAQHGLSYGSNFKIRFNQYDNYDIPTDGIAIDDVLVARTFANQLAVSLPASVNENAAPITGTVSCAPASASPLVVSLAVSPAGCLGVPATVTIPAGQNSVTFQATPIDDAVLNGSRVVTVTAASSGWGGGSDSVLLNDNEVGVLSLNLPATVAETAGAVTATLSVDAAPDIPVEVTLQSTNLAEIGVPFAVTIPAGQTSVSFPVTVKNDELLDGSVTTTVSASVPNWTTGYAGVTVTDDEQPTLFLSAEWTREGDAGRVCYLTLGGILNTPLTVTLSSSDTTELVVPTTVVVPAGWKAIGFPLTVIDDALADGEQSVTLTASAPGFTTATLGAIVYDNDAHHFRFSAVPSPQLRGKAFPVSVTAVDVNDVPITNFSSPVALTAVSAGSPTAVTPASLSTWAGGVWNGSVTAGTDGSAVVLTASDGNGHVGSSNAFVVGAGPLDHFGWSTIPSPQTADTPFTVTITAYDEANNVIDYPGSATLAAVPPATLPAYGTGTGNSSLPFYGGVPTARSTVIYPANSVGGPRQITGVKLNLGIGSTTAFTNFTIRLKHTTLSQFASTNFDPSGWTTVYRATVTPGPTGWLTLNFTTPFDYDGTSNVLVDFSFRNAANVIGASTYSTSYSESRLQYGYSATSVDPLTWSGTTGLSSYGTSTTVPNVQWLVAPAAYPLLPASTGAAFSAGVWTGSLSLPTVAGQVQLQASTGTVSSTSNAFGVVAGAPTIVSDTVFTDGFETGSFGSAWVLTGTGSHRSVVTSNSSPRAGTYHATFDSSSFGTNSRNEATITVNLTGRSFATLGFWAKGFNDDPAGPPPSPFPSTGADFDGVAISADGGVNWYEVQGLRTPDLTNSWTKFTVDLSAAVAARGLSLTSNFKIRFNHFGNDYISYEGIAIDDVLVTASYPGVITTLALPASLLEGTSGSGTVTVATPPASAAAFSLQSSAPHQLEVPSTVSVPAGQTSVTFPVTAVADGFLDGSRGVSVLANSAGYAPAMATTVVTDVDSATVSLVLPPVIEGQMARYGVLQLNRPAAGPLTFTLSSSDTTAVTVPSTVTVLPGHTSAAIPLVIIDDSKIDGTQTSTITATRVGFATGTIDVLDNEDTVLVMTLPASGVEGSPVYASLKISGVLPADLTINLSSSLSSRVNFPPSVVIPAGSTSVTFAYQYVDDHNPEADATATVTASATGFTSATGTTTAVENDPAYFSVGVSGATQIRGAPFSVTLTAHAASGGYLTAFTGPVNLASSSTALTPSTITTGWSGGIWTGQITALNYGTGVVLVVNDGYGHAGISAPFDIVAGPMHHFIWDTVPSPQAIDTPFNVTVRAVDAGGNVAPSFTGTAALGSVLPVNSPATGSGNSTWYNVWPTSGYPVSRVQTVYPASRLNGAGRITALGIRVNSTPSGVINNWTVRLKHSSLTAFTLPNWDNAGWTVVHTSNATVSTTGWVFFALQTPFDYDGTSSLMVDMSYRNSTTSSAHGWVYYTYEPSSDPRTIWGTTSNIALDPLTFANDSTNSRSLYYGTTDLQFTMDQNLAIRPTNTSAFSAGVWTGPVSVAGESSGLRLRATSGAFSGDSNAFSVGRTAPSGPTIFSETWESGVIGSAWTVTGGYSPRTLVTTANQPATGSYHLTMDSTSSGRNELTLNLDLSTRRYVTLRFAAKSWGGTTYAPTSPFTGSYDYDGVAISTNGTTWYEVQPLRAPALAINGTWTTFYVDLDAAIAARGLSYTPTFKIRFNHYGSGAIPAAGIALDDIEVTGDFTPGLELTLPASASEAAGAIAGTVTLPGVAAGATTVSLASNSTEKLQVPASVVVPAGQSSVAFTATALDDSILDGAKFVNVTATAPGFGMGRRSITILDNETATLTFGMPASISEGSGTTTATLQLSQPLPGPLTVALASSDTLAATVPASGTFGPGETKTSFAIVAVNDGIIDGTQTTTITATAAGWATTSQNLDVTDNETKTIGINLWEVNEGGTATGNLYVGGTVATPLAIALTSANPSRLSVPSTVTIPAGSSSVNFTATGVDNSLTEGSSTVTLTASSTGFVSATSSVWVYDNDLHHLGISTPPASQMTDVPFTLTVTAYDSTNRTIYSYSGPVGLAASAGGTSVPITPSTVSVAGGSGSPSVKVSQSAASMTVTASVGSITATTSPFTVGRSATLSLTPSTLPFALQPGDAGTGTFTLRNTGDRPLTWGSGVTSFAAVAQGPEFIADPGRASSEKAAAALQPGEIVAIPRPPADVIPASADAGEAPPALETVLSRFNESFAFIAAAIPSRYDFSDGVTGNNISDGGGDMYDGGNYLQTNLSGASSLSYSDNAIVTSPFLGAGGRYFTRKVTGLWVFAGDVAALASFDVTGNLGADGSGSTDTAVLSVVSRGVTYRGFVKRTYNAGDPSVNHLIIIADNGTATHETTTSTDSDYHRLTNLSGVTRIYYLLFSRTSGGYIDNANMTAIMTAFVENALSPSWLTTSPSGGTILPGGAEDLLVRVDSSVLTAGSYTRTLNIASNDPATPNKTTVVSLDLGPIATVINPEPAVSGGTTNAVGWTQLGGTEYQAEASTSPTFSGATSSGWIAAASHDFSGLTENTWYYRARSRRVAPLSGAWVQSSGLDFAADTLTNTTQSRNAGAVVLADSAPIWTEDFDAAGATWAGTIFSATTVPSGGALSREALTVAQGAPSTTPALPVNAGGDSEGRYLNSNSTPFRARMPAGGTNVFADGTIEGFVGFGGTYSSSYSPQASLQLRGSSTDESCYQATLSRTSTTSLSLNISRLYSGGGTTTLASATVNGSAITECYRLRFSVQAGMLSASVWRASASPALGIAEAPLVFTNGFSVLTAMDTALSSGVAGVGAIAASSNEVYFDDIAIWKTAAVPYAASGSVLSPVISPANVSRWNSLHYVVDANAAGTSASVDVLDAAGNTLASNVASGTDLNSLAAVSSQPSIRLRANLATSQTANTPKLLAWYLGWHEPAAITPAASAWSATVASLQDATPPTVGATAPSVVSDTILLLNGTAADAHGIAGVTVNGQPASTSDGFATWTRAVTLLPGDNTLAVVATDGAVPGNQQMTNVVVRYQPPAGDSDGDGNSDLLEIATGSNPSSAASLPVAFVTPVTSSEDGLRYLEFTYHRLLARGSLQYQIQLSTDLTNWSSPPADYEERSATPNADGIAETVVVRIKPSIGASGPARYVRVSVTLP